MKKKLKAFITAILLFISVQVILFSCQSSFEDVYYLSFGDDNTTYTGCLRLDKQSNSGVLRVKYLNPQTGDSELIEEDCTIRINVTINESNYRLKCSSPVNVKTGMSCRYYKPDKFILERNDDGTFKFATDDPNGLFMYRKAGYSSKNKILKEFDW